MLFGQPERAMHPRIAGAIAALRDARAYMLHAPHDFGGHREAAIRATDDAVAEVARIAALVNSRTQDIGARRLHTILERLLDPVSFEASDPGRSRDEVVDGAAVRSRLREVVEDEDLSRYIL